MANNDLLNKMTFIIIIEIANLIHQNVDKCRFLCNMIFTDMLVYIEI